jgi:hypothetical protein
MGFNILNQPVGGSTWWIGRVEAHNGLYFTQEAYAFTGDGPINTQVYRRSCNNGTFEPWYKLQLSQVEQDARYLQVAEKAAVNGLASLGADGKVPAAQLPAVAGGAINSMTGLYSARPAANSVSIGAVYYATDVFEQYRSNGTAWSVVGNGGNERGSATITALQSTTNGVAGPVDIVGMTTTFVAGERPVRIVLDCDMTNSSATNITTVQILLNDVQHFIVNSVASNSTYIWQSFSKGIRKAGLTPGATYTARARLYVTGGTGFIGGATDNPSTLSVISL